MNYKHTTFQKAIPFLLYFLSLNLNLIEARLCLPLGKEKSRASSLNSGSTLHFSPAFLIADQMSQYWKVNYHHSFHLHNHQMPSKGFYNSLFNFQKDGVLRILFLSNSNVRLIQTDQCLYSNVCILKA